MKNYNPFKMWGSYVVFVIIVIIIFLTIINMNTACHGYNFTNAFFDQFNVGGPNCRGLTFEISQILSIPMFIPALLMAMMFGEKFLIQTILFSFIGYALFGFLIGWAIHSIFRRLAK